MHPNRFIPRLDLLEARETPATGLTPDMVFTAEALANLFYSGTAAALTDQSFIRQAGNRAGTQSLAGVIVAQAPVFQDMLSRYVVELQQDRAANPQFADYYDGLIDRFAEAANHARLAGPQAQAVSAAIDRFNAADAASASGTSGTSGTTSTGVTGTNPFGVNTGTNNTLPTTGSGPGTTGSNTTTTTPPTGTGTAGNGTTNGTGTTGTGTGSGSTTGGSTTGTTPTQTSGLSSGTPESGTV